MDIETARKAALLTIDAYKRGMNKEETIEGFITLGICNEDADYFTDMVDLAYQRVVAIKMGLSNFLSNYDDDLIFQEAVKEYKKLMELS